MVGALQFEFETNAFAWLFTVLLNNVIRGWLPALIVGCHHKSAVCIPGRDLLPCPLISRCLRLHIWMYMPKILSTIKTLTSTCT